MLYRTVQHGQSTTTTVIHPHIPTLFVCHSERNLPENTMMAGYSPGIRVEVVRAQEGCGDLPRESG